MVRILVCGEATDRFAYVRPKLEAIVAKNGPFDLILLTTPVGNLSTPPVPLSVPTYFASLSHGGSSLSREVAPNLHYVGPSAQLWISSLSFLFSSAGAPLDSLSALINNADMSPTAVNNASSKRASENFKFDEDIANVQNENIAEMSEIACSGLLHQACSQPWTDVVVTSASPLCSDVFAAHARKIGISTRPRYHFSSAHAFVSLPPVRYTPAMHSTRVISVAPACKGRWAYAVDIRPLSASPTTALSSGDGCLDNRGHNGDKGFDQAKFGVYRLAGWKRPLTRNGDDMDNDGDVMCSKRTKGMEDRCWFCIGDALERHLIVLRGEHIVATVAKGGLHKSHLVIVPAAHIESSGSTGFSHETWVQLMDVLNAVARLYSRHFPGCFPYLFERSGGDSEDGRIRHMHIQAVAVENGHADDMQSRCVDLARNFGVEARLQSVADTDDSMTDTVKGAKLCLQSVREQQLEQFFWAQLSVKTFVVIKFAGGCAVPVHFGRMIVAALIGDDEGTDWRKRVVSQREEGQLAFDLNAILKQIVVDMKHL